MSNNKLLLDTNIIVELYRHLDYDIFYDIIYCHLEYLMKEGQCFSIQEVKLELSNQSQEIKALKKIYDNMQFLMETNEDFKIVQEILKNNPKFHESVERKKLYSPKAPYSADLLLIAVAKRLNLNLVSQEQYKPNSSKIPNICEKLDINVIGREDFYRILKNGSAKNNEKE